MANTLSFANSVDVTDAAVFIPEIWSMETLAAYKANLVMAALVSRLNHKGKRGDTIHIPKPVRGTANQKAANNTVTIQTNTELETVVNINQHWEYSRVLEDIVGIQALPSLRAFYTDDAGYALAVRVDTFLHELFETINSGTNYQGGFIGGDGETAFDETTTGNASALTDAGIRRAIQRLDDADVPGRNRSIILPPVEKRKLMGIQRFTEQAFTGEQGQGNTIRNGLVGDLYGVDAYVSSKVPVGLAADGVTEFRPVVVMHKEAAVLVEQLAPRAQAQYKLEALGTLMVSDTVFGGKLLREEAATVLVVPNA